MLKDDIFYTEKGEDIFRIPEEVQTQNVVNLALFEDDYKHNICGITNSTV